MENKKRIWPKIIKYGFVAGLAATFGVYSSDTVKKNIDEFRYRKVPAAEQFVDTWGSIDLKVERVRNGSGELETYLNISGERLPVLESGNGYQLGSDEYLMDRVGSMDLYEFMDQVVPRLDDEQREELAGRLLGSLQKGSRYEVIMDQMGSNIKEELKDFGDFWERFYNDKIK